MIVVFHPQAKQELNHTVKYYESQHKGLGKRFLIYFQNSILKIQSFPLMYHQIEENLRQCRLSRFPYGIIYRLKDEQIEIIAVMHTHRKPGYWKERIKTTD